MSTRLTKTNRSNATGVTGGVAKSLVLAIFKRMFDILVSIFLLVPTTIVGICLMAVNPAFNSGPLFYSQWRMGKDCKPFKVYKFRSMRAATKRQRNAEDQLETDRISALGRLMRQSRVDELPQIINVLRGDMSLIGPRPDDLEHAKRYLKTVEGYRARHSVRPGISGFAQVTIGYVEGSEGTRLKVQKDLEYIERQSIRLELAIILWTVLTILRLRGS